MACEVFIPFKPRAATLTVIEQANTIIDEYLAQDFKLTLRQLFYQFVTRHLLENIFTNYKRLGVIVRNARDGGLIDWDAIEDRTREVHEHVFWEQPRGHHQRSHRAVSRRPVGGAALSAGGVDREGCAARRDRGRLHRAARAVLRPSRQQLTDAAVGQARFAEYLDQGLIPLVLNLLDHDPNGIDMSRDNEARLKLYARTEIEVRRIALNMDQVREHNPPENFVKESDTRTSGYRQRFFSSTSAMRASPRRWCTPF